MFHNQRIKPGYKVVAMLILLQFSFGVIVPEGDAATKKRKDSATVEPTEEHMKEGERLLKLGDIEGASDEFQQSCYFARNRYNPPGWLAYGRCRKDLKDWAKAIEALSTHLAQTTDPAPDANCDLAECYIETGQFEKADRCITQARIEADYKNHRPYYTMGMLEERMGRYGEALGSYTTALGEQPWTFTKAWEGRARCYRKMKPPDYKQSLADYKKMIEALLKDLDWVEVYYGMAECLYKRGDHQGAIDHLLEALKRNPDHFDSHLALAHIFDEEKHVTSAVNQYEHAIRTAAKGYNTDKINKRIIFLQGELKGTQQQREVKASPMMRQPDQGQQEEAPAQKQRAPGDSGF